MVATAPLDATWVAAVHASAEDFTPLGTAVVIDNWRVLTSAHVVRVSGQIRPELWVAFPMAEGPSAARRSATHITLAIYPADLAVLEFADPVPDGVAAALLRCPKPADLVNRAWWAFGFGGHDPLGNAADGTVGTLLGYDWMRSRGTTLHRVSVVVACGAPTTARWSGWSVRPTIVGTVERSPCIRPTDVCPRRRSAC